MAILTPVNRVEAFQVTCPAGTAQAAAISTDVSFNPGALVGLEVLIPDGHAGLTGLQIAQAHQPLIPYSAGQFLISNNERIEWPLVGFSNTGSFQAITFNTDVFDHSWFLRFLIDDLIPAAGAALLTPPLQLA